MSDVLLVELSQGSSLGYPLALTCGLESSHRDQGKPMKVVEPGIVARKVQPAKRRAAGRRIAANLRRLQKSKTRRTAAQALAEARGARLAR